MKQNFTSSLMYQNFTKSEDLILRINKIKDLIKKIKIRLIRKVNIDQQL